MNQYQNAYLFCKLMILAFSKSRNLLYSYKSALSRIKNSQYLSQNIKLFEWDYDLFITSSLSV